MKNISGKALILITAAVAIALGVIGVRAIDDYHERKAWERSVIAVYPMANQHITWTGAGYSGR